MTNRGGVCHQEVMLVVGNFFLLKRDWLNEVSVHFRLPIDGAEIQFLHHFHFTFEVSDFWSPFGTTQPVFESQLNSPLWKWNICFSYLCDSSSVCLCPTVHHRLRSQLLPVRHPEEMASVLEHQEHHPESLWWQIQGYFRGYLCEVRSISLWHTFIKRKKYFCFKIFHIFLRNFYIKYWPVALFFLWVGITSQSLTS